MRRPDSMHLRHVLMCSTSLLAVVLFAACSGEVRLDRHDSAATQPDAKVPPDVGARDSARETDSATMDALPSRDGAVADGLTDGSGAVDGPDGRDSGAEAPDVGAPRDARPHADDQRPEPGGVRGRVRVERGTVVTDRGTLLRGASMQILSNPNYSTNAAFWKQVHDLGINAIRLDVKTVQIGKTVAQQIPELDKAVEIAAKQKMYVMFKVSIKPGAYNLQALRDFWSVAAARYRDRTHAIYEMTNEPVSGGPHWGAANQWTDKVIADLKSVYEIMRKAAPETHIALLSSANLYPDCAAFKAMLAKWTGIDWTRASVAFHHYPGTESFGEANIRCLKESYPLLMTETSYWMPDNASQSTPRTILRLYEKLGISWFSLDGKGSYVHLKDEILPDLHRQGYNWDVEN